LSVTKSEAGKMGANKKWHGKNFPCHTWAGYCKDIGISKRIANIWLKIFELGWEAILLPGSREIKFLAARRIGELVPKETGGRNRKTIRTSDSLPTPQRLTEFRKLAEIPIKEFKERIEVVKAKEEKITYNKILRGDWYQMSETTEWETPQWLFDLLNKEFNFDRAKGKI
jgi:hypothetical protein